jgi:lipopolysaccharide export system protein LptA
MTVRIASTGVVLATVLGAVLVHATALHAQQTGSHAQQPSGPPNALQGFSQNRDKPIKINSATLEVRDKDKVATFAGDVHLVQGDTTMRSKTLVVFYDDDPSKSGKPPAGGAQGAQQNQNQQNQTQQIKRVEAKGNVIVVQKDQTATGESGIFDMRANTVTLLGNVVISQGPNVVKGEKLTVDMTTGVSRVECAKPPCSTGSRVQMLVTPSSAKPDAHGPETPTPTPAREPRARAPQRSGLY